MGRYNVLWLEDDPIQFRAVMQRLEDRGIVVHSVRSVEDAQRLADRTELDLAIIDLLVPSGRKDVAPAEVPGREGGVEFARWLRQRQPRTRLVMLSFFPDPDGWFREFGHAVWDKNDVSFSRLIRQIEDVLEDVDPRRRIRTFIVHGHDEVAKLQLKNYLQNVLQLPEPIILHEQPSRGRTILEKLEAEARDVDLVFVLMTPEDTVVTPTNSAASAQRARQNVILELGYFLGRLGRSQGRVIVLHKGQPEVPSDVAGLIYIDIANGIDSAGESIRREVDALLRQI